MIQLFSAGSNMMQNVCTPLPFKMHVGFCILASVVYLIQFYRKGSWHYVMLMFAADATFATQIYTEDWFIGVLFVVEAMLLIAAGILAHRYNKKNKPPKAAPAGNSDPTGDGAFDD
ncbi:MAG: hypothetical protein IJ806_08835 [Ruminococcus sp.]|nr:hypothetical protein [Ruminococcus sp.]